MVGGRDRRGAVGVRPERLTRTQFDSAREQLIAATLRLDRDHPGRAGILSTRLYGAETTLFHAGVIETPPRKRHANKSAERASEWASIPPRLAATLQGYVEQMRLSLRPSSIFHIERVLREFALWLTAQAPEVKAVADLRRAHIERYKRHLAERPNSRGRRSTSARSPASSARCGSALSASASGRAKTLPRAC